MSLAGRPNVERLIAAGGMSYLIPIRQARTRRLLYRIAVRAAVVALAAVAAFLLWPLFRPG